MTAIGTIYNPASGELKDRVSAFKGVAMAYVQINAAGASDLFGEAEDISDAKAIIRRSMVDATNHMSTCDLDLAEQMGLLTDKQVRDYSILMQKLEFEALKKGHNNTHSQQSSQK